MTTVGAGMMNRWVLVHPEMGIFLGCCMGLGFWTKLDAVGQEEAVTFESSEVAGKALLDWGGKQAESVEIHPVALEEPSVQPDGMVFMTIVDTVRNGLPAWEPNDQLEESVLA